MNDKDIAQAAYAPSGARISKQISKHLYLKITSQKKSFYARYKTISSRNLCVKLGDFGDEFTLKDALIALKELKQREPEALKGTPRVGSKKARAHNFSAAELAALSPQDYELAMLAPRKSRYDFRINHSLILRVHPTGLKVFYIHLNDTSCALVRRLGGFCPSFLLADAQNKCNICLATFPKTAVQNRR